MISPKGYSKKERKRRVQGKQAKKKRKRRGERERERESERKRRVWKHHGNIFGHGRVCATCLATFT